MPQAISSIWTKIYLLKGRISAVLLESQSEIRKEDELVYIHTRCPYGLMCIGWQADQHRHAAVKTLLLV